MFRNRHSDRLRALFADQFQPNDLGFLYRKSGKGAAIQVAAAERDASVAAFDRTLRYSFWWMLGATVLLIGGLAIFVPDADSDFARVANYVGVGCALAVFMAGFHWAWNEPMRRFERRPVVGQPLSRAEARRVALSKITYRQLGIAVVSGLFLVWNQSAKHDLLHGWGRLWLVFGVLIALGAGLQAFRKWRHERSA